MSTDRSAWVLYIILCQVCPLNTIMSTDMSMTSPLSTVQCFVPCPLTCHLSTLVISLSTGQVSWSPSDPGYSCLSCALSINCPMKVCPLHNSQCLSIPVILLTTGQISWSDPAQLCFIWFGAAILPAWPVPSSVHVQMFTIISNVIYMYLTKQRKKLPSFTCWRIHLANLGWWGQCKLNITDWK